LFWPFAGNTDGAKKVTFIVTYKYSTIFSLLAFITPAHTQSSMTDRAIQCESIYHIAPAFVGANEQRSYGD
jgi:hypothetical protein